MLCITKREFGMRTIRSFFSPAVAQSESTLQVTLVDGAQRAFVAAVPSLFVILVGLQLLDWHSTLRGGAERFESNKLLINLSATMSFSSALALIKVADLVAIAVLVWAWRATPRLHAAFLALLCLVVAVYVTVIVNNYLAH